MKFFWQIGILFLCPMATYQRAAPTSLSYIGAVVEYSPVYDADDEHTVPEMNAKNYFKFIEKASEYSVDILVFPESTLSISSTKNSTVARSEAASYIPDPKNQIVPCDDNKGKYANSLKSISCAAKNHSMYVVINHREKVSCMGTDCPADRLLIYNTNVAFDRTGRVIARYRKYNLFGEKGTNTTFSAEPSTFTTDFGVTFGQFICFDILFQSPAMNLVHDLGVTDIVYSAHWFSELPYGYSLEAQAAWAHANDVNFLASGFNNPRTASGGSGIFIGQKGYVKVISENKKSNILVVAEIPKLINGKRSLNINNEKIRIYKFNKSEIPSTEISGSESYVYSSTDLSPYKTELIDPKQSKHNKTVCYQDFCCEFNLQINFEESTITSESKYYRYRLAVFNGTMSFAGAAKGGVKVCGIVACINNTLDSCGKLFDSKKNVVAPTTFQSIYITLTKIDNQRNFIMPVTFSSEMIALNATDFAFAHHNGAESNEGSTYSLLLTHPRNDLLSFALFGRNFTFTGSSSVISAVSSPILLLVSILVCVFTLFENV